ncbi:hypothetical protein Lal_00007225 [Lupinus albus]|nr:hypothetical protein Lal_00007225 [Lupinus albus]
MLMPTVIRDLDLGSHGLRMVACDPILTVPLGDGQIIRWWADPERTAREIARFSTSDGAAFLEVDRKLKALAAYLQPFFLEPPPNLAAKGLDKLREGLRLARRFRRINGVEMGEMRLWQARRPLRAGFGRGDAVPPAIGRRSQRAGLQRARHGRHGRDHRRHRGGGPRLRRGHPDRCAGRPDRCRTGPRHRRDAGGRPLLPGGCGAVERRPQAHVPGAGRSCAPAGGLPRRHCRDQDGRPGGQAQSGAFGGADRDRPCARCLAAGAFAAVDRADAGRRAALRRHRPLRRHSRTPVDRLRDPQPGRRQPVSAGPPHDDLLHPVRALQAARRNVGRSSRGLRGFDHPADQPAHARSAREDHRPHRADSARSGADLWPHRRQHLPRRSASRRAVLDAPGAALVAIPDAGGGLYLSCGTASGGANADGGRRAQPAQGDGCRGPRAVLYRYRRQPALDRHGGGDGAKLHRGVAGRAARLLFPAGHGGGGAFLALSAGRRALCLDPAGVRPVRGLHGWVELLHLEPALLSQRVLFRCRQRALYRWRQVVAPAQQPPVLRRLLADRAGVHYLAQHRGPEIRQVAAQHGAIGMWLPVLMVIGLAVVVGWRFGPVTSFPAASLVPTFDVQHMIFWAAIAFALSGAETASAGADAGGAGQQPAGTGPGRRGGGGAAGHGLDRRPASAAHHHRQSGRGQRLSFRLRAHPLRGGHRPDASSCLRPRSSALGYALRGAAAARRAGGGVLHSGAGGNGCEGRLRRAGEHGHHRRVPAVHGRVPLGDPAAARTGRSRGDALARGQGDLHRGGLHRACHHPGRAGAGRLSRAGRARQAAGGDQDRGHDRRSAGHGRADLRPRQAQRPPCGRLPRCGRCAYLLK